jgi:hypothetical protein
LKAADLYENPTGWCDTLGHVCFFEYVCVCMCAFVHVWRRPPCATVFKALEGRACELAWLSFTPTALRESLEGRRFVYENPTDWCDTLSVFVFGHAREFA